MTDFTQQSGTVPWFAAQNNNNSIAYKIVQAFGQNNLEDKVNDKGNVP